MADETLNIRKGTVGSTEMRFHELALQQWFYNTFFVRAGYPIPVIFGTPMDAFGNFDKLWKSDKNPFKYLFDLKDEAGHPVYEPYPHNLRYPLISVFRRNWKLRPSQSYGVHQFRRMNWPTVSENVDKCDLGNVSVSFRPMGWDFRWQVDHYAMRPDTQAYFTHRLFRAFATGGGSPQTWVAIHFPVLGWQKVRLFIDGDVENSSKEEPEDQTHTEFQTTFTLVMEGYSVDQDVQIVPALWNLIVRSPSNSANPVELQSAFEEQFNFDLRYGDNNVTLDSRPNVPSEENCQRELRPTAVTVTTP